MDDGLKQDVARHEIASAGAVTVRRWLEAGRILLVDVREPSEYEREHIPGALLLPLSSFDADLFPHIPGQRIVLHCAIGKRSLAAGKMLLKAGHGNVMHLAGGLAAWKEAGFETEEAEPLEEKPLRNKADAPGKPAPEGLHPGRILQEEFMRPAALDSKALARRIGISPRMMQAVLDGRRPMDAALSLRLARQFCTEEDFWLQLQIAHDLRHARSHLGSAEALTEPAGRGRCA